MKTISNKSSMYDFFCILDLRASKRYANILKQYNIYTVEQLTGAISPYLPSLSEKDIYKRGIARNYQSIRENNQKDTVKIKKLKKIFGSSQKEAEYIYNSLNSIKQPNMLMKSMKSSFSFGLRISEKRKKSTYWSKNYIVSDFKGSRYVIPQYERMGEIFDQGYRGTCVANAATSLIDYLSNTKTSRQFLYHQCKMIDGIPNKSGTYMNIPIELLSDESLIDLGTVSENNWNYDPVNRETVHQGPPPERCFDTERFYSNEPVFIRKKSLISDIKTLLLGSNIASPVPVTMGFALYESFNSYNTRETGWVTMPLPGEEKIGGHAMLIVGWDDDDKVFIVRNSWGTGWAAENKYGKPGHALIPFKYILKHTHKGCSVLSIEQDDFTISEEDRLYNTMQDRSTIKQKKVAFGEKINKRKKRKKSKFKKFLFTIIFIGILFGVIRFMLPGIYFLLRYYIVEIYLRCYTLIYELILSIK